MIEAPLQLKRYALTRLDISPVSEYLEHKNNTFTDFKNANYNSEISFDVAADEPNIYRIGLTLNCSPKDELNFPYRFKIGIEGIIIYTGKNIGKKKDDLVLVNGASMLYGALREVILGITARFACGPLLIPSVNFTDHINESDAASTESPPKIRSRTKKQGEEK